MRVVVAAGLLVAAMAGTAKAAPALPTDPWRLCPEAIAAQEKSQAIPKHLLSAIALAESARKHPTFGKRMPWPWTVMAEGEGRYLPTKALAIEEVRLLQARGIRNIDVGCMQVNLYHHADAFYSLDNAFDPAANVAYASKFLKSLYDDFGSWQEAAGRYHSATPELKEPYQSRVVSFWNEQQRLEFVGSNTFGLGPLTAGAGQGLEPVGDVLEALFAGGARHARVHVGVLVRLAGDRGLEVGVGRPDRQAGRGIPDGFEVLEVAVRVAGLTLGRRTKNGGHIVVAFDVCLLSKIEVPPVSLRLASKRLLQIILGLRTLQLTHCLTPLLMPATPIGLAPATGSILREILGRGRAVSTLF
mgnify:CR=1 FL=1